MELPPPDEPPLPEEVVEEDIVVPGVVVTPPPPASEENCPLPTSERRALEVVGDVDDWFFPPAITLLTVLLTLLINPM